MTSSNGTFSSLLTLWGEFTGPRSPHKCHWRGALTPSLICAWTNGWANNRDDGGLRHHHAHYDVTVMAMFIGSHITICINGYPVNTYLVETCGINQRRLNPVWLMHNVYWHLHMSMMTSSNGNIFPIAGLLYGEFTGHRWIPATRPVTRSFDVFFLLGPNKRLSKQTRRRWIETPSRPLWRHCNGHVNR